MIIFKGDLSKECRGFFAKKYSKLQFFSSIIPSIFVSFVAGVLAALVHPLIFITVLWFLAWPFVLAGISYFKKSIERIIPREIYIDIEDETIGIISDSFRNEHATSSVKQILDYAQFYDITFYLGDKDVSAVIQKDLIVEGTIAEFENLFSDKIVPAKKKTN